MKILKSILKWVYTKMDQWRALCASTKADIEQNRMGNLSVGDIEDIQREVYHHRAVPRLDPALERQRAYTRPATMVTPVSYTQESSPMDNVLGFAAGVAIADAVSE